MGSGNLVSAYLTKSFPSRGDRFNNMFPPFVRQINVVAITVPNGPTSARNRHDVPFARNYQRIGGFESLTGTGPCLIYTDFPILLFRAPYSTRMLNVKAKINKSGGIVNSFLRFRMDFLTYCKI